MKEYLENHLEPPLKEEEKPKNPWDTEDRYPESVMLPFNADIEYGEQGREIVPLKDGWTLEYTYEKVDEQGAQAFSKYKNDELIVSMGASNFRRLTSLLIKDEDGEGIDLIKKFKVKDIFFTTQSWVGEGTFVDHGSNIFSSIPPNSFIGIASILHEIGHIASLRSPEGQSSASKNTAQRVFNAHPLVHLLIPKKVTEYASGIVLKEERDAWSVAVAALRRALPAFGVSKEDFMNSIHNVALTTYSEKIRKIQKGLTLEEVRKMFVGW